MLAGCIFWRLFCINNNCFYYCFNGSGANIDRILLCLYAQVLNKRTALAQNLALSRLLLCGASLSIWYVHFLLKLLL